MSVYSFDTEIAEMVGVNAATIYHNLEFWINKNEANNQNFRDGNYWVYNSVSAWLKLFPFLTTRSIRTALDKLVDAGLVETGQFNDKGYDKTTWYAICQKRQIHLSETTNPFVKNDKPIPISKPISKPVENNVGKIQRPLLEKAFNHTWGIWKECKKQLNANDNSIKKDALSKAWLKIFNAAYCKKNDEDYFRREVNAIIKEIKTTHKIDGFNSYANMHYVRFLKLENWKKENI